MCAINPVHKKRFNIDCYTSVKMTKEEFEERLLDILLNNEIFLNTEYPASRFHVKESNQSAD
jgi:hypothetical protein